MDNKEKLKQLLDAGVISQEEYNNKISQLDSIKQLKELLDDGIITQEEYNSKIGIIAISKEENDSKNANNNNEIEFVQGNNMINNATEIEKNDNNSKMISLLVLGIIIAFVVGIAIGYACFDDGFDVDQETFYEYESSYYALSNFYLDSAVLVREGDGTYYHRYGCSTFPSEYSFWCYNVEAAKQKGYLPCPTCFGVDKEEYIKSNL